MGVQENKIILLSFWEKYEAGLKAGFKSSLMNEAFDMLADDVSYEIVGHPDTPITTGVMDKKTLVDKHEKLVIAFPDGLRFKTKSMIAEDDKVAMETESYGTHINGKLYNNKYYFFFQLRDGKILSIREYLDTLHATNVL